jgi:hypothetical protein
MARDYIGGGDVRHRPSFRTGDEALGLLNSKINDDPIIAEEKDLNDAVMSIALDLGHARYGDKEMAMAHAFGLAAGFLSRAWQIFTDDQKAEFERMLPPEVRARLRELREAA